MNKTQLINKLWKKFVIRFQQNMMMMLYSTGVNEYCNPNTRWFNFIVYIIVITPNAFNISTILLAVIFGSTMATIPPALITLLVISTTFYLTYILMYLTIIVTSIAFATILTFIQLFQAGHKSYNSHKLINTNS